MVLAYKYPSLASSLELPSHCFAWPLTAPSPSRSMYTVLPSPRTQVPCTVYDSCMCSMSPRFRHDILGLYLLIDPRLVILARVLPIVLVAVIVIRPTREPGWFVPAETRVPSQSVPYSTFLFPYDVIYDWVASH